MSVSALHSSVLRKCAAYVRARAFRFGGGLPASIEADDLFQVGMISAIAFFDKNGWPESEESPLFHLKKTVDGAMLTEINRGFSGTSRSVSKRLFSLTPFSRPKSNDDDDREFIDGQDEQFGFIGTEFVPPSDPVRRFAIFQAAESAITRDFNGTPARYKAVSGVASTGASWEMSFKLLGNKFSLAGFKTQKAAAKAKYDLLVRVRESVLPIDLRADVSLGKEKNAFSSLATKARGLEYAGFAMPSFLYGDPLRVLLILELMCLKKTDDWTTLDLAA